MGTFAEPRPGSARLADIVRTVRRRWRLRHVLTGVTIVVVAAVLALWIASAAMERAGFNAGSISLARVVVGLCVAALATRFVAIPWLRRVPDERVALYVEERVPSLDGALISAVEATNQSMPDAIRSSALTGGLVRDAAERLRRHGDAGAIERPALRLTSAYLGSAVVATALIFIFGPSYLRDGARLVLTPWHAAAVAAPYSIDVQPGNANVPRGTDQQIGAVLHNFQSELVELLVRRGSGDTWERIPMGSGGDSSHYSARLFDVVQDAEYFVESHGVRSRVYRLSVRNLPAVRRLDLELRYPSYTGMAPEKVEDTGDIAALIGTRVTVIVQTTMRVRGGHLRVEGDSARLLKVAPDGSLRGELVVRRDGFYRVELEAEDGTTVAGAVDYVIDAIEDQPPTVRIRKPGRDVRPTAVEEVQVEVEATDDYGVGRLELVYSVNGGPEQPVGLSEGTARSRDVVAGHTFFLEELKLQPGDVISYFARAKDTNSASGSKTASTDIYFMTVRRFDRDYKQNQQGGGGGGGQAGENPGALTARQREIVAATFKTERDKSTTPATEFREAVTTIHLSEGRLRQQVERLAEQMKRPVVQQTDTAFRVIAELLPQAAAEMKTAEEALGSRKTAEALPPEQRALQLLERAEAIFKETQVSRSQGQGGGGGGAQDQSAEDLADLFELETDKLRNQYEEVRRGESQSNSARTDETLERLKQLAARQQQENERLRQRMQQGAGGSGGGGGQRDLAQEAEEMARQLERLAREQKSPEMEESARKLQEAATAMRRSAAANGDASRASGAAALDRLERARRLLEQGRTSQLTKGAQDAAQRAAELARQQKEVAEDVAGLPSAGGTRPDRERRLDERKQAMAGEVKSLEEDLTRFARETRKDRPETARKLQEAAGALRDNRTADKIQYSREVMRRGSPDYARAFEGQISEDLEGLRDRVAAAARGAGSDTSQRKAQALDRARDLVRGLSSLDDRMREKEQRGLRGAADEPGKSQEGQQGATQRNGQQNQQGQPGQQGQQAQGQRGLRGEAPSQQGQPGEGKQGQQGQGQGQQGQSRQGEAQGQGQQGQQGQGQGKGEGQGQGQGQPGSQRQGAGGQTSMGGAPGGAGYGAISPNRLSPGDVRQFSRELQSQREAAEGLRRDLRESGRGTQDLDRLIQRLRAIESEKAFNDPEELSRLRSSVVEGFKEFEFGLRRELGDTDASRPVLGGGNDVPAGYREMVNEYFRSLTRKPRP